MRETGTSSCSMYVCRWFWL